MKLPTAFFFLTLLAILPSARVGRTEPSGASADRKLYVANTGGDSLSVIDLDKRKVAREIKIGQHPHGLAASPDGRWIYVTVESEKTVKYLDTVKDEVTSSVSTGGVPNQLAITPDGRWLYIAINNNGT